jgi:hypothetical protein
MNDRPTVVCDSPVRERSTSMNQEQFRQFWEQLQAPLKAKWDKITEADLQDIGGDLGKFSAVLEQRYGAAQKDEVRTWADRRYSHWTGNYIGYQDPEPTPAPTGSSGGSV